MSTRVTVAADFVTGDGVAVTTAARVLQVSRQAVYDRMAPAVEPKPAAALRLVAPALTGDWQTMDLGSLMLLFVSMGSQAAVWVSSQAW